MARTKTTKRRHILWFEKILGKNRVETHHPVFFPPIFLWPSLYRTKPIPKLYAWNDLCGKWWRNQNCCLELEVNIQLVFAYQFPSIFLINFQFIFIKWKTKRTAEYQYGVSDSLFGHRSAALSLQLCLYELCCWNVQAMFEWVSFINNNSKSLAKSVRCEKSDCKIDDES